MGFILIIGAIACFVFSLFIDQIGESVSLSKYLRVAGHFLIALNFLLMGMGKYYVGYNKVGMTIRVNSWIGKSFNFKDVLAIQLEEKLLIIQKKNKTLEFDLKEIKKSDIDRLLLILKKYLGVK